MDMPKRPIIKETSAEYLQMLKKQIEELMAQNEKLLQSNVRWEKERTNLQHRELQLKSEKVRTMPFCFFIS